MMEIRTISRTGAMHEAAQLLCQDQVYFAAKRNLTAISLADGTGSDVWAGIGAASTAMTGAEYLIEHYKADGDNNGLGNGLLSRVRGHLEQLRRAGGQELTAFSSTCLAVVADEQRKRFLAVHLGDGFILGRQADGTILVLSHPQNGSSRSGTMLTTRLSGKVQPRITEGSCEDLTELILLSDGWLSGEAGSTLEAVLPELLRALETEKTERTFPDDVSAICIRMTKRE